MDILYVPTWLSQIEHLWESPKVNRFFERSAHLGRLIMFDRRGSGMSDPIVGAPTLEEQHGRRQRRARRGRRPSDGGGARGAGRVARWPCSVRGHAPRRAPARSSSTRPGRGSSQSEDIPWANPPERCGEKLDGRPGRDAGGPGRASRARPHAERGGRSRAAAALVRPSSSAWPRARGGSLALQQQLIGEYDVRSVLPVDPRAHARDAPPRRRSRRSTRATRQYIAERIPGAKLRGCSRARINLMVAGDSDADPRRGRGVPHRAGAGRWRTIACSPR